MKEFKPTPGPWVRKHGTLRGADEREVLFRGVGSLAIGTDEAMTEAVSNTALADGAAAMFDALRGNPDAIGPEIGPLSWLHSAIDELSSRGPKPDEEDPSAFWEMIGELKELHAKGNAAIASVEKAYEHAQSRYSDY